MGSKSYEARAKKFDTKVPGATPFQSKLKEYELMAQTVGMFGEISKDGEPILEIAAWKRADEYCTFFASKPQVALALIGGFMKPRAEGELKPPIESLRVYTRWVLL